jgi:hypothetical protein
VDSVTSTGNTLWVKAHGINQRRLFDKGEGYCIRLLPHGASQ